MSARAIIACSPHKMVAYKHTVGVGTMGLEPYHVMGVVGTETADAILSALESAGYVVVPKEPTEAMILAAHDGPLGAAGEQISDTQRAWLSEMYRSMVLA